MKHYLTPIEYMKEYRLAAAIIAFNNYIKERIRFWYYASWYWAHKHEKKRDLSFCSTFVLCAALGIGNRY